METIRVEEFEKEDFVIVDTRTPREYQNHHIPGAVSVPLFENMQHHEVGYLYKQVSIAEAYTTALEYAQQNVPRILSSFEPYKNKKILVYCARGGLRSGIIVAFLKHYGYDAIKLVGGMKAYRNKVLQDLEVLRIPPIILLHGLVGAGKTKYIEKLDNAIDLEGCAQHRSSLFGAIGLHPNSQKQFLIELRKQLLKVQDKPFIFVEFESRKIGNVEIPKHFWEQMMKAEIWFLDVDLKKRVERYLHVFPQDKEHQQKYIQLMQSLKGRIPNEIYQQIIEAFEQENYFKAWELLWKHHYDPTYIHGTRHLKMARTIDANDFEKTLKMLQLYQREE
ncbi:tRNA 2-selenouridine(34) synthase MnmH [Candidatus Woesearchaeota archaeon]|nr:tRNA 2-selenouridine(34) synthase MnmH [Candidatus Woesearchaeota archaeon]